jgi:hypothetical protein
VEDDAACGDAGNDAFVGDRTGACDGGSGADRADACACDATASIP